MTEDMVKDEGEAVARPAAQYAASVKRDSPTIIRTSDYTRI